MKITLLSATLALSTLAASAQAPYTVTTRTEAYVPLTTAPVHGTTLWTTGNFSAPLPFAFKMGDTILSRFNLLSAYVAGTDTTGLVTGFALLNAALTDRGILDGSISKSPIRFQTTGAAPSRIFKAEVRGAGFIDELFSNGTQNDSVSFQVWLFEGSNAVEIHYGPSRLSPGNDYFGVAGPSAGFVRKLNTGSSGGFEKFYGLTGSPSAPVLDSFTASSPERGMTSYPVSGTVYRFTPRASVPASISAVPSQLALSAMNPNPFTDHLSFSYEGKGSVKYQIVAMNGTTLLSGDAGYGMHELDVRHLNPGAYIVRLSTSNEVRSAQFIKR